MPQSKLWTSWCDYFATGEGSTIAALVCYASSEAQARAQFTKHFGEFFAIGADCREGVVRNQVTEALLGATALNMAEKLAGQGMIELKAQLHYNLS